MRADIHQGNRRSWDAATRAHNSHKADQARYFRDGGDTLFPEELELLGPVEGLDLLHLQCNSGQDSVSLARRGARVCGVDISDEAIEFARRLSAESGIPAEFERADVLEWLPAAAAAGRKFHRVFTSYGVLCWLSDLRAWGRGIASVLRPGGRFVMVEFHPTAWIFNSDWTHHFPYQSHGEPMVFHDGVGDYVARAGAALTPSGWQEGERAFRNPHPSYEFAWGVSDILGPLLEAGLVLECFREYPYLNGCPLFEEMREGEGRRYHPPERIPALPMMFGLSARAPGGMG